MSRNRDQGTNNNWWATISAFDNTSLATRIYISTLKHGVFHILPHLTAVINTVTFSESNIC